MVTEDVVSGALSVVSVLKLGTGPLSHIVGTRNGDTLSPASGRLALLGSGADMSIWVMMLYMTWDVEGLWFTRASALLAQTIHICCFLIRMSRTQKVAVTADEE